MIVQEVYIGKVPEIEDIFTEFKELRHTYAAWKTGNTSKRTAKIEKMIEDFWGFKAFSLDIDPSSAPNAFTYPVATSIDIDPSKYIKTTSKGYFYTKEANVAALSVITKGLFCNKAFSDEEAFAVFLHEIGHSFVHRSPMIISQQEVYKTSMIIQIVQNIILGILMANPLIISDAISAGLSSSNFYKLFMTRINKAIKKIPVLREVNMSLSYLTSVFMNTVGNIFYTVTTLTGLNYLLTKYSKYIYDSVGKQQKEISGINRNFHCESIRPDSCRSRCECKVITTEQYTLYLFLHTWGLSCRILSGSRSPVHQNIVRSGKREIVRCPDCRFQRCRQTYRDAGTSDTARRYSPRPGGIGTCLCTSLFVS